MMDYKLNVQELFIALIIMFHIVVLFITMVKWYHENLSKEKLVDGNNFKLSSRTKYSVLDINKWSRTIFFGSLAFSLIAVSLVFNLSGSITPEPINDYAISGDEVFIIETKEHSLPPPPEEKTEEPVIEKNKVIKPKPVVSLAKINPVKKKIESPVFTEASSSTHPPKMALKVEKPITKPKPKKEEDKTYLFSEEMPMFPGTMDEEKSKELLSKYIYGKLRYPKMAIEQNIEGRAIIRFVVDTLGMVNEVEILMDPGGGTGLAAAELVKSMNKLDDRWTPGKHGGRKVKVAYTLPIVFRLKN